LGKVLDWIDERTGYRGLLHVLVLMNFPVSRAARWRYVWGGSLALMFLLELVTGTLLMTVYSPSESAAWGSVRYIETEVGWGAFVRGLHHYTAHMMVVVTVIHLAVVIITAGYRKPKEFTFWTGLLLAGVVLGLAISGNPLPWDQKGYWSYQVETGILGTMPVIGSSMKTLLVGGGEFGNLTLTRLYTLHVMVLPVIAVILLLIHVALMRREKLQLLKSIPQALSGSVPGMEPYWPYQTTRNLIVFAGLIALIVIQVTVHPFDWERSAARRSTEWEPDVASSEIILEAPADVRIPYVARPEWYMRFLFELRHMVSNDREILMTGVLPMVILLLLVLMPFYEKLFGRRVGFALAVVLTTVGIVSITWLTWSGYQRDKYDVEFQRLRRREIDYAGRAVWLAGKNGIPPEGPVTLLQSDAKAMGPLLFAANCATCHRWNGFDGTGKIVTEIQGKARVPAKASASDLHQFASRKWIADFLANPADERFFGNMDNKKGGEKIKNGSMTKWAQEHVGLKKVLQEKHLQAIAALLSQEAHRREDGKPTAAELKLGVDLFSGDFTPPKGKDYAHCLQCHDLKAGDPEKTGNEGIAPGPNLNGYGSREWLIAFIRNPGDKRFYGARNVMPAFDKSRLSDRDLGMLVDWMRDEWQRETTPEPDPDVIEDQAEAPAVPVNDNKADVK
jgi:ubiquinol-cytochrome c reductase cytochrome b subunit